MLVAGWSAAMSNATNIGGIVFSLVWEYNPYITWDVQCDHMNGVKGGPVCT
jgi:hypothetical protein